MPPSQRKRRLALIEDLKPDLSWLSEENGEIQVTRARSKFEVLQGSHLSASVCVALALNEACCKQGKGMVGAATRLKSVDVDAT